MAKRICTYGLLCGVCLVLGYLESLVPIGVPGVKLGLANSVALLLLLKKDVKGAITVNLVRILLSALLFSSPFALLFSLSGAAGSMAMMLLLLKTGRVSAVGVSAAGGAAHNVFQLLAALILMGKAVLYLLPLFIVAGGVSGGLTGFAAALVLKKLQTTGKR